MQWCAFPQRRGREGRRASTDRRKSKSRLRGRQRAVREREEKHPSVRGDATREEKNGLPAGRPCAKQGRLSLTLGLPVGRKVVGAALKCKDVDPIGPDERQERVEQDAVHHVGDKFDSSDTRVAFFLDAQLDDARFGMPFVRSNGHRTDGLEIIGTGLSAIFARRYKAEASVRHFESVDEEQGVFDADGTPRSEAGKHPGRVLRHAGSM